MKLNELLTETISKPDSPVRPWGIYRLKDGRDAQYLAIPATDTSYRFYALDLYGRLELDFRLEADYEGQLPGLEYIGQLTNLVINLEMTDADKS